VLGSDRLPRQWRRDVRAGSGVRRGRRVCQWSFDSTHWELYTGQYPHNFILCPGDIDLDGDVDVVGLPELTDLLYLRNDALFGGGCAGTGGNTPEIGIGSPTIGNPFFGIGLGNALPLAPAILGVSTARVPSTGCSIGLDLANLILPIGAVGIATTAPAGNAWFSVPLPNDPGLIDLQVYAQWGVMDPNGGLSVGAATVALTKARTIILR
jgi:hypothetical protein